MPPIIAIGSAAAKRVKTAPPIMTMKAMISNSRTVGERAARVSIGILLSIPLNIFLLSVILPYPVLGHNPILNKPHLSQLPFLPLIPADDFLSTLQI